MPQELVFHFSEDDETRCTAQIRLTHTIDDERMDDSSHPTYTFKVVKEEDEITADWLRVPICEDYMLRN